MTILELGKYHGTGQNIALNFRKSCVKAVLVSF